VDEKFKFPLDHSKSLPLTCDHLHLFFTHAVTPQQVGRYSLSPTQTATCNRFPIQEWLSVFLVHGPSFEKQISDGPLRYASWSTSQNCIGHPRRWVNSKRCSILVLDLSVDHEKRQVAHWWPTWNTSRITVIHDSNSVPTDCYSSTW